MDEQHHPTKKHPPNHIPLAEWIVAGIGLLLIAGSLVFLVYRSSTETSPPAFEAELDRVTSLGKDYLAEIQVHNRGGEAVAALTLSGQLRGAAASDSRQVVIDYLPGHSSRSIGIMFADRPDPNNLEITFESYVSP